MKIVEIILGFVGIIAFVWNMFGVISGFVFMILALNSKDKEKKKKYLKYMMVSFGGLALLFVVFILYALLFVVKQVAGI